MFALVANSLTSVHARRTEGRCHFSKRSDSSESASRGWSIPVLHLWTFSDARNCTEIGSAVASQGAVVRRVHMSNLDVVKRYAAALNRLDIDDLVAEMHPDIVCRYPQSGEVIRGRDNYKAFLEAYPGLPESRVDNVVFQEQTFSIPSALPGRPGTTVSGVGDMFVFQGYFTYPSGDRYYVVTLFVVREGKVAEETTYFAAPFDPPEWRAPFRESP